MCAVSVDKFYCQSDYCGDMYHEGEVLFNEMCGCNYLATCFMLDFKAQTSDHILNWDFNKAGTYTCRSPHDYMGGRDRENTIISKNSEICHIVKNDERFNEVRGRFLEERDQTWEGITGGECEHQYTALAPEYARNIYVGIKTDDGLDEGAPRECLENAPQQLLDASGRNPAFPDESWGLTTKLIFVMRCVYHTVVSILSEIALFFVGFFISADSYNQYRSDNVGERMTELYMQYYGFDYDYSRPNTFENKIVRWFTGE